MDIETLRNRVDLIDAELVSLLNRRMELTVRAIKLKEKIEVPERENSVLEHVKSYSSRLLSPNFSESVFKEIIAESRKIQERQLSLIGFQGEHGAYSEMAVQLYDEKAVAIPHSEFKEIFDGVKSGVLDTGLLPIENSLAGNVSQVDDLLIEEDLHVVGEVVLPVHHCLIALPGTDHKDIRVVYSHPQALSQCRGFISRNKLEARSYYDTAGAAMMLAREEPGATAVIASSLAATLYNLEILKENIEDSSTNATRFLVLSDSPSKEDGDKCSLVFSTAHKPGALFTVLSAFSEADLNLTRIESRPIRKDPGRYAFMLDFLGSEKDSDVQEALTKAKEGADMFKFLGCYKKAQ